MNGVPGLGKVLMVPETGKCLVVKTAFGGAGGGMALVFSWKQIDIRAAHLICILVFSSISSVRINQRWRGKQMKSFMNLEIASPCYRSTATSDKGARQPKKRT
jgi:hypothetical protein